MSGPPLIIFTGVRHVSGPRVYRDNIELDAQRSLKIRNHSPDGFEWGYGGSGPAQLALALLMELLPVRVAEAYYQKFKRMVIAGLNNSAWVLTSGEILAWVEANPQPERFATELEYGEDGDARPSPTEGQGRPSAN
jgi:hypothetical protein